MSNKGHLTRVNEAWRASYATLATRAGRGLSEASRLTFVTIRAYAISDRNGQEYEPSHLQSCPD